MIKRLAAAATLLAASAAPAFAHLDPAEHGSFMAGVSHPLFGLDHILAMVAVGLWAALLAQGEDRRALWLVPAGLRRHDVPRLRRSACRPAAALRRAGHPRLGRRHRPARRGRRSSVPAGLAMVMVGFFAFFHGHAHGGELGRPARLSFGVGFALSTALLHAAGIALGLGLGRMFGGRAARLAARACRRRHRARRAVARRGRLMEAGMVIGSLVPGEVITAAGDIELNKGAPTVTLKVANSGDRPIQVGSHYHFFETNEALRFDRDKARGMRLDIAAGTAVRFEPGQERDVTLVPLGGKPRRLRLPAEDHGEALEHDPEKWEPVFGKDHARPKKPYGRGGHVGRRRPLSCRLLAAA